jgi:hypothetical protein
LRDADHEREEARTSTPATSSIAAAITLSIEEPARRVARYRDGTGAGADVGRALRGRGRVRNVTLAEMARRKYQVFISSTYRDLHLAREAVTWEILKARHIPAGMESFPATDNRGWDVIQRTIEDSDYYVVVVAGRYGSIDPTTSISWTEREYDYALSKGMPVFAFVRAASKIVKADLDTEPTIAAQLDAFAQKLRTAHLCKEWLEIDDLKALVAQALHYQIELDEEADAVRPGWVRGSVISLDVPNEMARLSKENAELRERVAKIDAREPRLQLEMRGEPVQDVATERPLFVEDPPRDKRAATIDHFLMRSRLQDEEMTLQDECNMTYWLEVSVANVGSAVARNVRADFEIENVAAVILNKRHYTDLTGGARVRAWYDDANEPIYVSSESVDETSQVARIEQRVRSVGIGQREQLVRIGLVAPGDAVLETLRFAITYDIRSEDGAAAHGKFDVTIQISSTEQRMTERELMGL